MKAKIFYIYARKDEQLRDELEVHLALLKNQGFIESWHDRKVTPGSDWENEVLRRLSAANIILFLVSADLLASEFCYGIEMKRALERHEIGDARVVPIMLRECDWENAPFAKIQALPKDALPVTSWDNRDSAWTAVTKGIRQIAQELTVIPEQTDDAAWEQIETTGASPVANIPIAVKSLRHCVKERNRSWWRFSWVAEIENSTDQSVLFDITVDFLDRDGFVVDRGVKRKLTLSPGEGRPVRDFKLINTETAKDVESLASSIKIRATE